MPPCIFCYEITQLHRKKNVQPPRSSQWVLQRTCPSPRAVGQKEPPKLREVWFFKCQAKKQWWKRRLPGKTWNQLSPVVIPSITCLHSQLSANEFGHLQKQQKLMGVLSACLLCIFHLHQHRLRALRFWKWWHNTIAIINFPCQSKFINVCKFDSRPTHNWWKYELDIRTPRI